MYAYLRDNDHTKVFDFEEEEKDFELQRFLTSGYKNTSYFEIDAGHGNIDDLNLTSETLRTETFNKKRCYWRLVRFKEGRQNDEK